MVIPFEEEYRKKFYELEEQIFNSNFWSEGKMKSGFFGRRRITGNFGICGCTR